MSIFSSIGNFVSGIFGGGKKESVTTTTTAPKTSGVVVTDFSSGASVTTKTSGGKITSQTYSSSPSSRSSGGSGGGSSGPTQPSAEETAALAAANRPGGLVDQTIKKAQTQTKVSATISNQLKSTESSTQIDPRTGRPYGVVSAVQQPTGLLEKGQAAISNERSRLQTQAARDLGNNPFSEFKRNVAGFGLGLGEVVIGTGLFAKALITKPLQTAKSTVTGLYGAGKKVVTGEGFPELGRTLRNEPGYATGIVVGNIALAKGTGEVGSLASKGISNVATRASPSFARLTGGAIKDVSSASEVGSTFDIPIAGSVKSIGEPLSSQVRIAGTEVRAVSAARDLFTPLKSEIVVNKPLIPGSTSELERSFFADPRGRVRVSRLDVLPTEKASFLDVVSGDITFKRSKPQIVVVEQAKVAQFPAALKDVESALKSGKTLTSSQASRLEQFQLTPTGEFKPVGFLSREPEITLAPGEVLSKKSKLGVTLIEGRRVQIVGAEIGQPSQATAELLGKFRQRTITAPETKLLRGNLYRETGFDLNNYVFSSRNYVSAPSLAIKTSSLFLRGAFSSIKYPGVNSGRGSLLRQLSLKSPGSSSPQSGFSPFIIPRPRSPSPRSPGSSSPVYGSASSPQASPIVTTPSPVSPITTINLGSITKVSLKKFTQFKQSAKISPQLLPQPKKYQPTLAAAALNIKSPKIPKAYAAGAGALIQRPLVTGRRKRK